MSVYGEEIKQGKPSFSFESQDEEAAICQSAIQENLVGSRETLRETTIINKSYKNHREEWT